jgi:hypothetical protein
VLAPAALLRYSLPAPDSCALSATADETKGRRSTTPFEDGNHRRAFCGSSQGGSARTINSLRPVDASHLILIPLSSRRW